MTPEAQKSPTLAPQHVATFYQLPNGIYEVSCDGCTFREQGALTRNEAYHRAYQHTCEAGAA